MSHTITIHLPAEHSLKITSTAFSNIDVRLTTVSATELHTISPDRSIRIGPFSVPRDYRIISEQNTFVYEIEEEKLIYNHEGTGLFTGGAVTVNAGDATKVDVAAGSGVIVDNFTDPEIPEVIHLDWPAIIGTTAEFVTTDFGSFVCIDKQGDIQFFPSSGAGLDKRTNIFLGILGHSAKVTITSIASAPTPGYDQTHMFIDMADTLRNINKTGNVYSPNGANLMVDKSAGSSFAIGYNHPNSAKSPNITGDPLIEEVPLVIGLRDGAGGFKVTGIDADVPVANYDNNSGDPVAVPASDPWQIFRIYHAPAINNHILVYGQNLYKNQASAEASIFGEVYDEAPDLEFTILRGYLIAKRDATDLTDSGKAKFIEAGFLGGPGSGVSTSTTNLQQAYANSEEPEITTNSTQQALTIKEGTGTATNTVLEITDNSDALVLSIDGQGQIAGAIEGDTTANRPATPINYQMYFDTTLGIPIWYDGTNWIDAAGITV